MSTLSRPHDKLLFTPGPLTTSRTVKQAMLRDLGSRDIEFIATVRRMREQLLALSGAAPETYTAVPMQGSGTFGVEATLAAATPHSGKLLVAANGAYGERMLRIAAQLGIATAAVRSPEDAPVDAAHIDAALAQDPDITAVAVVHCETTTGVLNPIAAIGEAVQRRNKVYCVDAMSSFGAIPIDLHACQVDFLMTSSNKCLEGVPGLALVLARRDALLRSEGNARSLSLDLLAQWRGLEGDGQFRFTPPTHVVLALEQALRELEDEGGIAGRSARYRRNHEILLNGMRALGFQAYIAPAHQSYIITSFRYPNHPAFTFTEFYERLSQRGMLIYPGKVSNADCFRIGTIGRLVEADIRGLLAGIADAIREMGVALG